jgi:hypothetical protein
VAASNSMEPVGQRSFVLVSEPAADRWQDNGCALVGFVVIIMKRKNPNSSGRIRCVFTVNRMTEERGSLWLLEWNYLECAASLFFSLFLSSEVIP